MAVVQTSYEVGDKICKALGLDGKLVTAIDISVRPNSVVTFTVEMAVEADNEWINVIENYKLVLDKE